MEQIGVYWSFRSPYSYLATPGLMQIAEDYEVELNLRVVLPIAVRSKAALFDASNRKPAMYILMDSMRRAQFLGLPYAFPTNPDPVKQDYQTFKVAEEQPLIKRLAKLGVEAQRRGKGLPFAKEVSHLMEEAIKAGDHLDEVERNHQALEVAGHWGVPTMVVRGEPFFGQDRIETLRWRLDGYGLRKGK